MNKKQEWEAAVLETDTLTTQEAMVALVVASRGDFETGTKCEQSLATIAGKAKMSERQAQRHVQSLIKKGWLMPNERSGRTTSYSLVIPTPVISVTPDTHDTPLELVKNDDTPDTSVTPTPDTEGKRGDTHDTPPLTLVTPDTTNTIEDTTKNTIEASKTEDVQVLGSSGVEVLPPPTAAVVPEPSLIGFSKVLGPENEEVPFAPFIPPSLIADEEWVTDREAAQTRDELDDAVTFAQKRASQMPSYRASEWVVIAADARNRYESGTPAVDAVAQAMGALAW